MEPEIDVSGNKIPLIIGVALLAAVLVIVLFFVLRSDETTDGVDIGAQVDAQIKAGEALDTVGEVGENPLEGAPNLNPVENINPFKDVYKNPFD